MCEHFRVRGRRVRGRCSGGRSSVATTSSPSRPPARSARLSLDEALELLLLIAKKEPERFDRAAARWHARFVLETRRSASPTTTLARRGRRPGRRRAAGAARDDRAPRRAVQGQQRRSAAARASKNLPRLRGGERRAGGDRPRVRRVRRAAGYPTTRTLAARSCRPVRVRSRRLLQARLVLPEPPSASSEPPVESEARPAASPSPPRFIYRFRRTRPLGTGSLGGEGSRSLRL